MTAATLMTYSSIALGANSESRDYYKYTYTSPGGSIGNKIFYTLSGLPISTNNSSGMMKYPSLDGVKWQN